MFRKILIGMALVAIGCALAGAGYKAGQALAERAQAADARGVG
jgi:hypothetical protein